MRIAKALKKRLVKWLLDPSVIKEIELPIIKVGKNTVVVTPNGVKFSPLTADPTLQQALLWYRSDLDQWRYSPDGSNVKQLGGGYPPDNTYICLDANGKLTICDGAVTTAKLANGAVTTDKIAGGAITSAKINEELRRMLMTVADIVPFPSTDSAGRSISLSLIHI